MINKKENYVKATEILMSEHRVIERVVAAMDQAALRLEGGETVRPNFSWTLPSLSRASRTGAII